MPKLKNYTKYFEWTPRDGVEKSSLVSSFVSLTIQALSLDDCLTSLSNVWRVIPTDSSLDAGCAAHCSFLLSIFLLPPNDKATMDANKISLTTLAEFDDLARYNSATFTGSAFYFDSKYQNKTCHSFR